MNMSSCRNIREFPPLEIEGFPKQADISPDSRIVNWWTFGIVKVNSLFFMFYTHLFRPMSMIWSINETSLPSYCCVFFLQQNISYRLSISSHLSLFYFSFYNIRITISRYMLFYIWYADFINSYVICTVTHNITSRWQSAPIRETWSLPSGP